ncbi:VirB2 family type IV secretion system major pilin TrwL [Bartonella krasnovii]|uniref:VirB2 family type IV secretion system major pilin TrwL n=1 Tax=Bartonella krasnovii TaxID=2267275 RepID=UPI001F4CDDFD|nr:VirB2 family type IV secretion system major pilin TrwL [Bartonella krasnovii]UNF38673.1 VirB2 family type IV secretion system major pilin TrwL [Bartonella krasnovii]UNF45327.1 VirB2 family type IV secretion system major pilin TrwL [Bartonella krasnovii]UNF50212.1 VirB2 family type IV secretion system major pilin TrwL [Bartonella krasnovii]
MKQLNILQTIIRNKTTPISAALTIFFMNNCAYAQVSHLQNAEKALNGLKGDLTIIIPLAAGVILLCLAIAYAGRYIEKSTFIRWAVGVVVAGSAAQLADLLFKGANS